MKTFFYKVGMHDDIVEEMKKWEKERVHAYKTFISSSEKLKNEGFMNNTSEEIISKERDKREWALIMIQCISDLFNRQLDCYISFLDEEINKK